MTEEFLQYLWKHRLFRPKKYMANTGEPIEIIHTGEQNTNAGPDFSNVRIKIADTLWAGNCEVHVSASDWNKHDHHANPAYNNIILHVVLHNNADIRDVSGNIIPTIELEYESELEENYSTLLASELWIPCAKDIHKVQSIQLIQWLTSLSVERLEKHSVDILSQLAINQNHWEEAFYISLARSFGFGINGLPFQMLARSMPLSILSKHKNSLFQIEALLFGQSGLIVEPLDEYTEKLCKEYLFLQKKYALRPIEGHLWKYLRLRPSNFPTIRIAQFAALIHASSSLFSKILTVNELRELYALFKINTSEYWDNHFSFGKTSVVRPKQLSAASINILLINAVIPFIFVHGKLNDNQIQQNLAISFLEELPAEKNSIMEHWHDLGIVASNAFESQALIELKNSYCQNKKCLYCGIGMHVISQKG
jgi:hypothetical protein